MGKYHTHTTKGFARVTMRLVRMLVQQVLLTFLGLHLLHGGGEDVADESLDTVGWLQQELLTFLGWTCCMASPRMLVMKVLMRLGDCSRCY